MSTNGPAASTNIETRVTALEVVAKTLEDSSKLHDYGYGKLASYDATLTRFEDKLDTLQRGHTALMKHLGIVERRGSQAEIFAKTFFQALWGKFGDPNTWKMIAALLAAILTGALAREKLAAGPLIVNAPTVAAPSSSTPAR